MRFPKLCFKLSWSKISLKILSKSNFLRNKRNIMANPSEKNDKITKEKYVTRTTVGHKHHDITFRTYPMYSFGQRDKRTLKDAGHRGPAAYPCDDKGSAISKQLYPKSKDFKYSLGSRRCLDNTPINPGPAAYPILNNSQTTYFNEKLPINSLVPRKAANHYTFGGSRKPDNSSLQTEPALYPSVGKSMGPQEQKNKFTFSGRPKTFRSKFETPGPAIYPFLSKEKVCSIFPKQTQLRATMKAPYKDVFKSNSPAPNTYPRENAKTADIMKTMISGTNAPAYSIGLKHGK